MMPPGRSARSPSAEAGRLPVSLVGHSLGGRAALLAGHFPEVVSVAALAPWFMATDQPRGLEGKRVLIVHGDRDRVASLQRAATVARRVAMQTEVEFVVVEGGKHAMLSHGEEFIRPVTDFVLETLGASFRVGLSAMGIPFGNPEQGEQTWQTRQQARRSSPST